MVTFQQIDNGVRVTIWVLIFARLARKLLLLQFIHLFTHEVVLCDDLLVVPFKLSDELAFFLAVLFVLLN